MNCPACGSELELEYIQASTAMDYYKCNECAKTTEKCHWWTFHVEEEDQILNDSTFSGKKYVNVEEEK